MAHYKIGELAQLTGCLVETIRFYERKGLVPAPVRSDNNYRVYGDAHAPCCSSRIRPSLTAEKSTCYWRSTLDMSLIALPN
jgi:hypothetical protein